MIPGLGGMGKSRLARAYVHEAFTYGAYDATLWFKLNRDVDEAQNKSSLETQYREWFSSIREDIKEDSSENALFNLFKNKISQHYKRPLIIYDDVPSGDFLRDLLPQTHAHVLITSRDALGWKPSEMITSLEGFQEEESVRFLQQESGRESEEEKGDALKVAKVLGGLPLALEQAASWARLDGNFSSYLDEFSKTAIELMRHQPESSDYSNVVATTWTVTMKKVSPLAQKLMRYFAYLKSEDIPVSLLLESFLGTDTEIKKAIRELVRYSMVKKKEDQISVHQLVQLVNRSDDDSTEIIEVLLRLFMNKAEVFSKANLDDPQVRIRILKSLPHVFKLYKYAKMLTNPSEELLEKFEWAGLMISLIGIHDNHRKLSGKEDTQETNNYWQKKLKNLLSEKGSFFREVKGREEGKAFKWFYNIGEKSHRVFQGLVGQIYFEGFRVSRNEQEAMKWWKLAAEQGDVDAQVSLASMYSKERGGLLQNDAEAMKWYRLAAEQGHAIAQTNLGAMYEAGRGGLSQDDVEAVKWWKLAAEQGYVAAQSWLGMMHEAGRGGLPQDVVEAVKWYKLAAEQGHDDTQWYLGYIYSKGRGLYSERGGLPKDDVEAIKWWKLAADSGHELAKEELVRRGLREQSHFNIIIVELIKK